MEQFELVGISVNVEPVIPESLISSSSKHSHTGERFQLPFGKVDGKWVGENWAVW